MDMPQNIPPQVLSALQQQSQGMNGGDITSILAQLAQMSPDELSQALSQLGVNIPPDQLVSAAENWLESAADTQASSGGSSEEAAEGETGEGARQPSQAEEEAEGETDEADIPANAQPTGYSPQAQAQQAPQAQLAGNPPAPQGAPPMPPSSSGRLPPAAAMRGAASGGAGTMDDLISAAMMQSAAGNPNAPVPSMPRMRGPKPPGPGAVPTSTGNARQISTRSKKRG